MAFLIAVPLLILLVTNRKPKEKTPKPPKPTKPLEIPPKKERVYDPNSDRLTRRFLLLLLIIGLTVVSIYVLALLFGPTLIGLLLFGGATRGLQILLLLSVISTVIMVLAIVFSIRVAAGHYDK